MFSGGRLEQEVVSGQRCANRRKARGADHGSGPFVARSGAPLTLVELDERNTPAGLFVRRHMAQNACGIAVMIGSQAGFLVGQGGERRNVSVFYRVGGAEFPFCERLAALRLLRIRILEPRKVSDLIGMQTGLVGGCLADLGNVSVYGSRVVGIAKHALPHDFFEPDAACRVAAVTLVEVPAVPVESISQVGTASVLDGIDCVDDNIDWISFGNLFRGLGDHGVHLGRVVVVVAELGVGGMCRSHPWHMVNQLEFPVGGILAAIVYHVGHPGLESFELAVVPCALLQADVIPAFIQQTLLESSIGFGDHGSARFVAYLAVAVGLGLLAGPVPMSFQVAAGNVQLADYDLLSDSMEKWPELLLYCICAETVANRQYAYNSVVIGNIARVGRHLRLRFRLGLRFRFGVDYRLRLRFGLGFLTSGA